MRTAREALSIPTNRGIPEGITLRYPAHHSWLLAWRWTRSNSRTASGATSSVTP